eukprot:TRINITY_DN35443_c0_g1_i2.p4 TRINITY_DN35443_c0_g1~~TRINITY_DN35443_c0_g1_i2.p4  ORF type:complete len:116 (+),score=12.38 TRINITY_DN35443_c0_g1_i2:134-481(+)
MYRGGRSRWIGPARPPPGRSMGPSGESAAAAARRELQEETALSAPAEPRVLWNEGDCAVLLCAVTRSAAEAAMDPSRDPDGEYDELQFWSVRALPDTIWDDARDNIARWAAAAPN